MDSGLRRNDKGFYPYLDSPVEPENDGLITLRRRNGNSMIYSWFPPYALNKKTFETANVGKLEKSVELMTPRPSG
jgi:hypothetical protein